MKFMKWRWLFFTISLSVLIPGLVSLVLFGLKPSIDFTGGSLLELKFTQTDENVMANEQLQTDLEQVYQVESAQESGPNQMIFRGKAIDNDQKELVLNVFKTYYPETEELRFESVGPALGEELLRKTMTGVLIATVLIMIYVWVQFDELKYGVCAILAMMHDSLILLGLFSLLGYFWGVEVDVLFVTALLTTLSFSVHDTIVVFDRIRELKRQHRGNNYVQLVDTAVTETLSRSLNNSVTIIIMLAALTLLGGDSIKWFSLALLFGAITGTYSSTFTAAPLLILWDDTVSWWKNRKKN